MLAPPMPYLPRLRALALFGRRSVERAEPLRCRRPKTITKAGIDAFIYSITSSAVARSDGATVMPSAWAVFRLITSSNLSWVLDRHFGRLGAFQDATDIGSRAPEKL